MNRKIAIWTGSQSRRPEKRDVNKQQILSGGSISESYEKIRVIDFLGTLNQTPHEKRMGVLRLHCDIYRSNRSSETINLITSFDRMIFHNPVWNTISKKHMRVHK